MPIGRKNPIGDVLREFQAGRLHSGKGGPVVKDRDQAVAIALSVARKKGKRIPRKPK